MSDYLFGVVAAEMPAAFEVEALKAQACAARTYTVRTTGADTHRRPPGGRRVHRRPLLPGLRAPGRTAEEPLGSENAQTYSRENRGGRRRRPTAWGCSTRGSPSRRCSSPPPRAAPWTRRRCGGSSVDYLRERGEPGGGGGPQLPQPGGVLRGAGAGGGAGRLPRRPACPGDPSGWFGAPAVNEGGTVSSIPGGGRHPHRRPGADAVRPALRLLHRGLGREPDFTFSVTGYGHGVGMSQYGGQRHGQGPGSAFDEILTWYYTGTQVEQLW